tara:strand:- start:96844 stop:98610 length:1767 start_codon:yes stop_codon:yes gene_type:complete
MSIPGIKKSEFLQTFPPDEFWRFFVDGVRQSKGWKVFENNEPGYLQGMYTAFLEEMTRSEPLSVDVLLRVHANSVTGVKETNYEDNLEKAKHFRPASEQVGFDLSLGSNLSKKGYEEIQSESAKHGNYSTINGQKILNSGHTIDLFKLACTAKDPQNEATKILENYHRAMQQSGVDQESKVKAIIEMVVNLERLHPFNDANCRTFCMVVLYRELLNNNIMPPIMDNPNQFDGFSMEELSLKVMEGSRRAQELILHGEIETQFRTGVLQIGDSLYLPAEVSNLRDLAHIEVIDYQGKPKETIGEHEDKLVQQMIVFEAINNVGMDKIFGENTKAHAKWITQHIVLRDDLADRLKNNMGLARQDFIQMIDSGCTSQVNTLFQTEALNANSRHNMTTNYPSCIIEGLNRAKKMGRTEIFSNIQKIVLDDLVFHCKAKNSLVMKDILKQIYRQDPEYGTNILISLSVNPDIKGALPPELMSAATILQAHKQHKKWLEQKIESIGEETWSPMSIFKRSSSPKEQYTQALQQSATISQQVIQAVMNGDNRQLNQVTAQVDHQMKRSTSREDFATHYLEAREMISSRASVGIRVK